MSISQQKESRFTNIAHIISAMVLAFSLICTGCGSTKKSLAESTNALAGQDASYDKMGKTYYHLRKNKEEILKTNKKDIAYVNALLKETPFDLKSISVYSPLVLNYQKDGRSFQMVNELDEFLEKGYKNQKRYTAIVQERNPESASELITKKDGVYVSHHAIIDFYTIKPDKMGNFSSIENTNYTHFEPPLDKEHLAYIIPKYNLLIADRPYFLARNYYYIDINSYPQKHLYVLIDARDVVNGIKNNTFPFRHEIGIEIMSGLIRFMEDLPLINGYEVKRARAINKRRFWVIPDKVAYGVSTNGRYIDISDIQPQYIRGYKMYQIDAVDDFVNHSIGFKHESAFRSSTFTLIIPENNKNDWNKFYQNEFSPLTNDNAKIVKILVENHQL